MIHSTMSQFRLITFSFILTVILVACGGNPRPTLNTTQPISPTEALGQVVQPTNTQSSTKTQVTVETLAPVNTQAAISTPAQSAYSLSSVCPLVTKEEAEANLGTPVKDPVEQNYPPVFSCRYEDTDGIYFLDVSVVEFSDATQAEEVFKMAIDLNNYPLVSGIGDRAYQSEFYDITAQKGKYELSINLVSSEDKEIRQEKARVLAVKALERLP